MTFISHGFSLDNFFPPLLLRSVYLFVWFSDRKINTAETKNQKSSKLLMKNKTPTRFTKDIKLLSLLFLTKHQTWMRKNKSLFLQSSFCLWIPASQTTILGLKILHPQYHLFDTCWSLAASVCMRCIYHKTQNFHSSHDLKLSF